jgi:hypothetical protein
MMRKMSDTSQVARDALLRTLQDILGELADSIYTQPKECRQCEVIKILSSFAVKLRKAGLQEEAEIIRNVREFYNI